MSMDHQEVKTVASKIFQEPHVVENVSRILALQPSLSGNPVGHAVLNALVACIKAHLPGTVEREDRFLMDVGPYRQLFYPGYAVNPNEEAIKGPSGVQTDWSAVSTNMLCQAIHRAGGAVGKCLRSAEIDTAVSTFNQFFFSRLASCYAGVFSRELPSFGAAVSAIGDPGKALQSYEQVLLSTHWITAVNHKLNDGHLPNVDWFLYHHWIKLNLLGSVRLKEIIDSLKGKLVTFPENMSSNTWTSYRTCFPVSTVDYQLFNEADKRIRASGSYLLETGIMEIPEIYSRGFCAFGPGKGYYNPPSSCFAAGAKVRMADGSLAAIEAVQPGEEVATPAGAKRVALAVEELRAGRALFSLAGCTARFTAIHPFRCADGVEGPECAVVEPRNAAFVIPTLQSKGIQRLAPGVRLLAWTRSGPSMVPLAAVEPVPADPELADEPVYDLILEPDETGISEYYVGDEGQQFLVRSEAPVFTQSPFAAAAVLSARAAFQQGFEPMALQSLDLRNPWNESIVVSLMADLLPAASRRASGEAGEPEGLDLSQPLSAWVVEQVEQLVAAAGPGHGQDAAGRRLMSLFLAHHGEEVEAAIAMGWRRFAAADVEAPEILAVSVLSLNLGGEQGIPEDRPLQVTVSLAGPVSRSEHAVREDPGAVRTAFTRRFHDVAYFECPGAMDGILTLDFSIQGGSEPAAARGRIAWPLRGGYGRAYAVVEGEDGRDRGFLSFDVRLLARADQEREEAERPGWTGETKRRYAHVLGTALGAEMSGRLQRLHGSPG